jgi:hypothetical protein
VASEAENGALSIKRLPAQAHKHILRCQNDGIVVYVCARLSVNDLL